MKPEEFVQYEAARQQPLDVGDEVIVNPPFEHGWVPARGKILSIAPNGQSVEVEVNGEITTLHKMYVLRVKNY